jgi:hypothetical protein
VVEWLLRLLARSVNDASWLFVFSACPLSVVIVPLVVTPTTVQGGLVSPSRRVLRSTTRLAS